MLIYGDLQNAKGDANAASGDMHLTREVPKHRSEYARPFLQLFINYLNFEVRATQNNYKKITQHEKYNIMVFLAKRI